MSCKGEVCTASHTACCLTIGGVAVTLAFGHTLEQGTFAFFPLAEQDGCTSLPVKKHFNHKLTVGVSLLSHIVSPCALSSLTCLGRVDTGGNRQVMDHLKDTGMLEEVSRGNDQLGKERRKGKVFQVRHRRPCCYCNTG